MVNASNHARIAALLATVTVLFVACSDDSKPKANAVAEDDAGSSNAGSSDAGSSKAAADPTLVTLKDGTLQGDVLGESVRFLKIPYTKPPVGDLRWKAPVANDAWQGMRHESEFASPCPQPSSQQSPASTNEDCLYLNVWRPMSSSDTKGAPVLVWIHGGGFTTGSAADKVPNSESLWYNGQPFAERGVVVVTINYRLGVFGFFAHPSLSDEGSPVGNQGLLDQQRALHWVHDNIAAFGGNPGNVTIAGESAGSASVCMHTVAPGSRGLFQRAVSESGGCTAKQDTNRDTLNAGLVKFAKDKGCEGSNALKCLRDKPASDLVSMQMVDRTMGTDALRMAFSFGAIVDGPGGFMPEPSLDLYNQKKVAQVPYLIGSNTEEANLYYLAAPVPADETEYKKAIADKYGAFADRVLAMYPLSKFEGNTRKAMARIATDSGLLCSTLDTARRAVAAGLTVYMYNFNIPWSIARDALGPSHASEISHVFGTPYNETDPKVAAVGDVMNTYWANFAKNGDPNYADEPTTWPRYMPDADDNDKRLQFDPDYKVLDSFRKDECKLWRDYDAQQ